MMPLPNRVRSLAIFFVSISAPIAVMSQGNPERATSQDINMTLFVEANFAEKFGGALGFETDFHWPVTRRGSVGLVLRSSVAFIETNNVDGEMTLGSCTSFEMCSDELVPWILTTLAAGFGFQFTKTVSLRWGIGVQLIWPIHAFEVYNLIPHPFASLALDIEVVERDKYTLLLTPIADLTVQVLSRRAETLIAFGLGLTIRWRVNRRHVSPSIQGKS